MCVTFSHFVRTNLIPTSLLLYRQIVLIWSSTTLTMSTIKIPLGIDCLPCVCRLQDYWLGYKLFAYAYYSHSATHESEFKVSKLGWWICPFFVLSRFCVDFGCAFAVLCACYVWCFKVSKSLSTHRYTCVAPTWSLPSSFPPCYSHHMHATSPSRGDVLQVGLAGGLQ